MKHLLRSMFLLVAALTVIMACSTEDAAQSDPINQDGGEVFRSQVVTVALPGVTLAENEYQATLGGEPIIMMKSEDNKLLFLVPFSTTIGMHDLVIASLNNATVHYEVQDTVLSDTPDATMAPFFDNVAAFVQTLDASPQAVSVQNSLNSFTAIYNNADATAKTQMAVLYKANKAQFDNMLLNDFSSVTGKNLTPDDVVLLAKHSYAVWAMAGGALVALYAPDPIEKAFGVGLASAGAYKAYKFFEQLAEENLNTTGLMADEIMGTNNRDAMETHITFQNDVVQNVNLSIKERPLIVSDAGKTQADAVAFFKIHTKYNFVINKVNAVITWVNANVAFADFDLIQLEVLPGSTTEVYSDVTAGTFSKINLTVTHPNLQLVSTALQGTGALDVKIKIIGSPSSMPVESFLNYSYSDGFSTFSGKLPIKVQNEAVGKWYVGSYTLGPVNYVTLGVTPCGGQNGQSGEVYIYMNNENTEMVCYFKSVVSEIPSFYTKMFFNRPYPYFLQETSLSYNLGPDPNNTSSTMTKYVTMGGFTSDDNWVSIRSTNMQVGGTIAKNAPNGTACGPSGTIEFGYNFPMTFQYTGTTPPSGLTSANLSKIFTTMNSPSAINVVE